MNCLAVDDEPLALDLVENFIKRVPFLNLIATCTNAIQAIEVLNNQNIDLLFLDIQMPDVTGIQFVNSLKTKPLVIFTTAYSHYAVEGFELDAVDYLLKPYAFERFLKAVNKANELYSMKTKSGSDDHEKTQNPDYESGYFFVKADYQSVKIDFKDILFIEGLKDYVKIYTHHDKILTLSSLKGILKKLPHDKFIRIHRSFIVSIPKIKSVQRQRIIIDDEYIPIGDNYKDAFFERLDGID